MEETIQKFSTPILDTQGLISLLSGKFGGMSRASLYIHLNKLIEEGKVQRVGKGRYVVTADKKHIYQHDYSDESKSIADKLVSVFPLLDFRITELIQFNEFLNHQIAHNAIFVYVEKGVEEFVFEELKELFPGKVLLRPDEDMYQRYWCDDMIVIERLISQTPKGDKVFWHTSGEKLLVDIFSDNLINSVISESEWATVYIEMFNTYALNESRLFRYASRRGSADRIRQFIGEQSSLHMFTKE